jgi:uncharacterized Zn finger protein
MTVAIPTRETIAEKADRLLTSGAVWIEHVGLDGVVARVTGDHAAYLVASDGRGRWQCSCAYVRPNCSHVVAVRSITERQT